MIINGKHKHVFAQSDRARDTLPGVCVRVRVCLCFQMTA